MVLMTIMVFRQYICAPMECDLIKDECHMKYCWLNEEYCDVEIQC